MPSTSASRLRVYLGPESESAAATATSLRPAAETTTVPFGEVLPLLADAFQSRRMWLEDFDDDDITISSDLYEVLLAFEHYRRPSA